MQLAKILAKIHGGGVIPTTRLTVGEFLEDWLTKYAAGNVRETSLRSYCDIVRQHLIPSLSRIPNTETLATGRTRLLHGQTQARGARLGNGPKTLSGSTVRKHHAVLHAALRAGGCIRQ